MLYLKTDVIKWLESRALYTLSDYFFLTSNFVTVNGEQFVDIDTISKAILNWAAPIVAPSADPERKIREFQSEVVGFIPMEMPDPNKQYFGDGDNDFCHGGGVAEDDVIQIERVDTRK